MGKIEILPEQYIVDSSGKKTHVVLRIEEYEQLIEEIEDLEEIEEYEATKDTEELIPWEEAKKQIGL